MDGISVAASIAGLVSLADTVFTRTYRYAKTVKHASKEINELAIGVRQLSSLLHGLKLVLHELEDQGDGPNLSNLAEFRLHHISSCLATLTRIQKKLDKHQPEDGEHQPVKQALRILKWPFSVADTKELLAEVEKHKTTINVALSGDTLATIMRMLSRQEDLTTEIKDMKDKQNERWAMEDHIRMDKDRKEVLSFFGKIDPTSNHMMNLKLRHPLTGLWVTESLIFREWLLTRNSKLWLSGIPGAGKTVIAASIIEEAMKESGLDRAVAYFYCDYQDVEKQSPVNILGSIAGQLARQSEKAFSKLEELYRACHLCDKPSISPEPQILSTTIREMAFCFDDVSIIVDGLDECGTQTSTLVELLFGLSSDKNSNTRTLFLSRDEGEIRGHLCENYSHMEIAAQSEDLRLYVAAEMEARQQKHGRERLRIKSTSLKEQMMKTLVEKADGMFRWVVCQFDYLCQLPNDAEKRKALGTLPPGLNATYERILERVNKNDESIRRMVQNTLQWIVSPIEAIPANALCHAISIKDGDKTIDPEAFFDEEDILTHCSSLIRRSANGKTLEMAHFTVKEFLLALDSSTHSPYSRYSQSKAFVYPQLAVTCLTYITLDCFRQNPINDLNMWEEQHDTEYPLREHAVEYWVTYAESNWQNPRILALAKMLFDPAATGCFLSWARDLFYYHYIVESSDDVDFTTSTSYFCAGGLRPLHMAAALGLVEICQWLIESGCSVNDKSNVGTPLHCSLLGLFWLSGSLIKSNWSSEMTPFGSGKEYPRRMQVFKLLLDHGADCNASYRDRFGKEFPCSYLALYSGIARGAEHPLVKLVAAGARVEKQLLKQLDNVLEEALEEDNFVEALINALKETNQDHSIRLQAALKLDSSSGFDLVKSHSTGFSNTGLEDLIDMFRSAVRFDQTQVMEELIRDKRLDVSFKGKDSDATFLHDAAEWKSIGAARLLLSLGVDINAIDNDNDTPLHLAMYGDPGERYEQCISLFLDHGANVNAVDCEGRTVWHDAAICDHSATAMSLLLASRGTETQGLGIADKYDLTPLMIAAQNRDVPTCELLVSHASYDHRFCPEGLSLVHYAVRMNSINLLRQLQEKGIELTEKTRDGRTGLHFMSNEITLEIVRLFTDSGVDAISAASNGETPLHILACMTPSPDLELLGVLFDIFATKESINSTTAQGLTPLHYALYPVDSINLPNIKHAESLIARGADVHMRLPDETCYLGFLITRYIKTRNELQNRNNPKPKTGEVVDNIEIVQNLWRDMKPRCALIINSTKRLEFLIGLIDTQTADEFRVTPLNWFLSTIGADELADLLLEKGVDVNLRNAGASVEGSWSAIHYTSHMKTSLEIFRKVFNKSSRPMEPDKLGFYLIHIACIESSRSTPVILQELCNSGFDPNLPTADGLAITPLMLAARNGKQTHFQVLVELGANIRARDSKGWEVAHHAVSWGQVAIIEQLIDLDIDWNSCLDGEGHNILQFAVLQKQDGLVAFIVQRSLLDDLDYQGPSACSALLLAAACGQLASLRILLNVPYIDINTVGGKERVRPIHSAAASGHIDIVRELLKHGCLLTPDECGMTPQLYALKYGWQDIFDILEQHEAQSERHETRDRVTSDSSALNIEDQQLNTEVDKLIRDTVTSKISRDLKYAISAGNLKLCQGLVGAGFGINHTFSCGCTPLLYSLAAYQSEIARFLLELGFSATGVVCASCPAPGYSVVHLACIRSEDVDILKLLLEKHPSAVSRAFQHLISPFHEAVARGNTEALETLIQYWKAQCLDDLSERAEIDHTVTVVPALETSHPNRRQGDLKSLRVDLTSIFDAQITTSVTNHWAPKEFVSKTGGGTLLHLAVFINNLESMKVILHHSASIDSANELGRTPLHLACASGHLQATRLLLDSGANPFSRDFEGCTPAMAASATNHDQILSLILEHHKDLTITSSFGWNLLHCATAGGPEIFSFLFMEGVCPYAENVSHRNAAGMALWQYEKFPGFPSLILNLDLDFDRLRRTLSQEKSAWRNSNKHMVRLFLKRVSSNTVYHEMEATTWREGSILGDAAEDGQGDIVRIFVQAGANLELDQGPHGTPLLAACFFGRFQVVKFLVRAGAKVFSIKGGKPCSAVEAARAFPEIVQWLLVERYTDQPCIELFTSRIEEEAPCTWSGVQTVEVETAELYTPDGKESSFDHAKRLAKLRRDLQGQVVNVFHEAEKHRAMVMSRRTQPFSGTARRDLVH